MDTLMAFQNLAVTVNGLKESIHLQATRVSTISNENNQRSSKYHSKFSELLNKYSRFANDYKFELANLHQSLLNDISLQQKQRAEQEREMQESFSSKSSHSNLEIAENVQDTEYHSPVTNMNNMHNNVSLISPQIREDSEFEPSQNTVSMDIPSAALPSQPQPKSIPVSNVNTKPASTPKRNKNQNKQRNNNKTTNNRNNQNQNQNQRKTQRQNTKNTNKPAAAPKVQSQPAPVNNTNKGKASKPSIVRTVTSEMNKKEVKKDVDEKYVYNEKNVKFDLPFQVWNDETKKYDKKVYKHTTVIYIGNIPTNIKVAAVQFFIMKKFKVTMRQIEETKLSQGRGFSQSAQVRFRSDVPLDHIVKYMDMLNSENAKIKEDKKAAQDSMHVITKKKDKDGNEDKKKSKKKVKTSWNTRVFIKFQDPGFHYSYYENEDEMYNDRRARHELFVRNFDVLDAKCHKQLTDILLQFGDLYKDIQIKLDAFGDPYCIVIFKYKNDAVYCCNSDIYFGGRRLEIRYSKRN